MLELKCKIGSLAAEARFTRNVERRQLKEARRIDKKYAGLPPDAQDLLSAANRRARTLSLRFHRIGPVRREARLAQLAYAFLRGKPYLLVERSLKTNKEGKVTNPPNWDAIEKLVLRFTPADPRDVKQRFAEWKDAKLSPDVLDRLAASDLLAVARQAERRKISQAKALVAQKANAAQ